MKKKEKTLNAKEEVLEELMTFARKLQARRGRRVSLSEAIKTLLDYAEERV